MRLQSPPATGQGQPHTRRRLCGLALIVVGATLIAFTGIGALVITAHPAATLTGWITLAWGAALTSAGRTRWEPAEDDL